MNYAPGAFIQMAIKRSSRKRKNSFPDYIYYERTPWYWNQYQGIRALTSQLMIGKALGIGKSSLTPCLQNIEDEFLNTFH